MADHQAAAGQHLVQWRWTRQQEVDPGLLQVVHVCGIVHMALGIHVAPAQRATVTMPAHSLSYSPASTSAYFCSTALRRTFWLGVTSPSSTLSSVGRISNRLTVSQRSSCSLACET